MPGPEKEEPVQALDGGPQINILFSAPDFTVPCPDSGGVKIARISPEIVVKFGSHVTLAEAKNMMFAKQNTETLPVPKIFACYSYGPINRDIEDHGSLFDTYIFMSFVESQTLDKVWESYDEDTKAHVTNQLKEYLLELRQIRNGSYIGSANSGPVTDQILESYHDRLTLRKIFNNAIIDAYQSKAPKRQIKNFLSGMLCQNNHQIVFTHGDLRLQNIMVNDGSVSGILYWEFSGWYPEYWEFLKALYIWQWQNDWTDYLVQILRPYYAEYTIHCFLTETLW
ncbi:Protein kinase-like domain [Penicillium camemberti]|uniref:Protein kinase-like domain n=1 Tax=Penicillium camemberti (strain FM 013) TaxID=1429867 RepID=A0A0G4P7S5_PENC3|nr:Protein kinase-like domain [Penicillium camemberti]